MHHPSYFLFSNGELAHILHRVWRCPFSETGQLTKHSAQIALLKANGYWAGSFFPLLAKVDFACQAFVAIVGKYFGTKIGSERISRGINNQEKFVVNVLASSQGFALQFALELNDVF